MSRTWRRTAAIVAPVLFIGVLVVTHLTDIYDAALQHQWVHDLEHAGYLAVGVGAVGADVGGGPYAGRSTGWPPSSP